MDFEHNGKPVHVQLKFNDDWLDPTILSHFVRMLSVADPTKIFLYHDTKGQDCVVACVTRDQAVALKEAGVGFDPLTGWGTSCVISSRVRTVVAVGIHTGSRCNPVKSDRGREVGIPPKWLSDRYREVPITPAD